MLWGLNVFLLERCGGLPIEGAKPRLSCYGITLLRLLKLVLESSSTLASTALEMDVVLKFFFHALVLLLELGKRLADRSRLIAVLALLVLNGHLKAFKTALYGALALVILGSGASFALVSLGPDASELKSQWMTAPLALRQQAQEVASNLPDNSSMSGPTFRGVSDANTSLEITPFSDKFQDLGSLNTESVSSPTTHDYYATQWSRNLDSAQSALAQLGIDDAKALSYILSTPSTRQVFLSKSAKLMSAITDPAHQLKTLTLRWADQDPRFFNRLVIQRVASGFETHASKAPFELQVQVAGGRIKSSLFQATDQARIPDAVANQLAEIFSGDIDFHRALRQGDRFSLMFENLLADGEVFKTGKILNAEFINRGKSYQAIWFSDAHLTNSTNNSDLPKGDYYSMDGLNLKRTFLASPLAFSRVTSGFSMRLHPILQTWKAHLGVDYAAPTGTPVRTVGNGIVESAGVQNGFGNVVFIKHPQGPLTVYAHLSHISVKKGQSVSQGDIIGAVGSTGWATGPHLHFEFRLNGQHQDPMTLAKQNTPVPLANEFKPQFLKQAQLAKSVLSGLSESALETVDID